VFGPLTEPLGTSRLLLEPLAAHHAEEMAEALADPRLHRYIGGRPPTAAELRARYARLAAGPAPFHQECWPNWVVRRRRDRRAVGFVQATVRPGPRGSRAAVAWMIGMPYQGFGFATEAARAMVGWLAAHGVTEITAAIHPGNAASATVARRLGLSPAPGTCDGEVIWRSGPLGPA